MRRTRETRQTQIGVIWVYEEQPSNHNFLVSGAGLIHSVAKLQSSNEEVSDMRLFEARLPEAKRL
jgi:hypothetical protein